MAEPTQTAPRRIQRSRAKEWRMPEGARYVGRPTQFGSPFSIAACEEYHREAGQPPNGESPRMTSVRFYREWLADDGQEQLRVTAKSLLRGQDLACWCPLGQPCHADVLLEVANAE